MTRGIRRAKRLGIGRTCPSMCARRGAFHRQLSRRRPWRPRTPVDTPAATAGPAGDRHHPRRSGRAMCSGDRDARMARRAHSDDPRARTGIRPALPLRLRQEPRGLERRASARRARPHPSAGRARHVGAAKPERRLERRRRRRGGSARDGVSLVAAPEGRARAEPDAWTTAGAWTMCCVIWPTTGPPSSAPSASPPSAASSRRPASRRAA
jgi:hypothetical protein